MVYAFHSMVGTLAFGAVIIFTIILIRKLRKKNVWCKLASEYKDKSAALSNKERKTASIVAIIASILIVSYTPSVILMITTFCKLEFSLTGRHHNIFFIWLYGFLYEAINSSMNIFLYLKMRTNYGQTFLVVCK